MTPSSVMNVDSTSFLIAPSPFVRQVGTDSDPGARENSSRSAGWRLRRVAVVEHERVAVGILEERHVANARVEDVALEHDASALELRPRPGHVVDLERDRMVVGLVRHPEGLGLEDLKREAAGLELDAGRLPVRDRVWKAENRAVELDRGLDVLRRDR